MGSRVLLIGKAQDTKHRLTPTGSTKYLIDHLAHLGLSKVGLPSILQQVKEWQETRIITKKQAGDLRQKVRRLSTSNTISDYSPLVRELDEKINSAKCFSR